MVELMMDLSTHRGWGEMVNLVYFGASLAREIGDPLPCLRADPEPHWVSQQGLVDMLNAGETVEIRPATFAEFLRIESAIALGRIAQDAQQLMKNAGPGEGIA
jgi:hypothetical protein